MILTKQEMNEEIKKENYKMNIHLIGFELRKDLLTKKDITIKVKTIPESPDHSNCSSYPDEYKTSATIPVEKISKSNQIFNVNVRKSKVNNERMNKIILLFKMKGKVNIDHKIAYAIINYHNLIQMLNDNEDAYKKDEQKSKNQDKVKYVNDKVQTIPIYLFDKSKQDEFTVGSIDGTTVGSMKVQLSLFQFRNDYPQKSNYGKGKKKLNHKFSKFIDSNKHISINMHKFKNYHLGERESSDYQKSNQTYQIKKQYENLL